MEIVEKKLENSRMELQIEVPGDEVDTEYKRVFAKIQNEASLKGFRKGKVPMNIVIQRFKDVADKEVAESLVRMYYVKAVEEKSLNPINMPDFDLDDIDMGKPLTFKASFDIPPSVEIGKYKGYSVDEPVCNLTDKDVENEITALRERHASISKKEEGKPAEDGDYVKTLVKRIDNIDKAEIDNIKYDDIPLIVGKGEKDYDIDKHVNGMGLNEEKEISVKYPKDYNVKDLAGQKVKYLVKISEINKMDLPELDDEFAKDLGDYSSLEELRSGIKENLDKFVNDKGKAKAKADLLDKVVEDSKFDLPMAMIKDEMVNVFKRFQYNAGMDEPEDIEKVLSYIETNNKEFHEDIKKQAVKNIQSNLVLLEIAKAEEIKASEEKFKEALENIAKQSNKPIEEIEKLAGEGNARNNIESEILLNEAYDFIYEKAKVSKQKPVPYSDFVKL